MRQVFFRNSKEGVHYNMLTESNLNKICAERLPETCSLSGQALRPSVTRALIFIEPGDSTSSQVVHSKLALVCRKRRESRNPGAITQEKRVERSIRKFFPFRLKTLDERPSQVPMRVDWARYSSVERTFGWGVSKQTATAKVTTAPKAMRQGNSIRGSQAGAQRAGCPLPAVFG